MQQCGNKKYVCISEARLGMFIRGRIIINNCLGEVKGKESLSFRLLKTEIGNVNDKIVLYVHHL